MNDVCPECGLKHCDADELQPGEFVCTCDDPFDDDSPAS